MRHILHTLVWDMPLCYSCKKKIVLIDTMYYYEIFVLSESC